MKNWNLSFALKFSDMWIGIRLERQVDHDTYSRITKIHVNLLPCIQLTLSNDVYLLPKYDKLLDRVEKQSRLRTQPGNEVITTIEDLKKMPELEEFGIKRFSDETRKYLQVSKRFAGKD